MTTPTAPKYRTTTQACSCLGFWYRRSCKHYRAYGEAVALVLAQEALNLAWDTAQGPPLSMPVYTTLAGIGKKSGSTLSRSHDSWT